jgi:hypothetical protein
MDNIHSYLRKLAKRVSSQNLFAASKDMGCFQLFLNKTDLSKLQQDYLSYLYFYYNLYQDIYSKKVSEKVLNNEVFEDAYSYYKNKHSEDKPEKSSGKKRKLSAVFSKDNKINFSKSEVK